MAIRNYSYLYVNYEGGLLVEQRKYMQCFRKLNFYPQNLIFLKISDNSQTQKKYTQNQL